MTLKEKFGKLFLKGHNTTDFEKIAEDFAIGFAMQISTHCNCDLGNDTRSYKQLLKIYKKEKGL